MNQALHGAAPTSYRLTFTGDGVRRLVSYAGRLHKPGAPFETVSLAEVAHLLRNGLAEPADAVTALDGELAVLLQAVIPRFQR